MKVRYLTKQCRVTNEQVNKYGQEHNLPRYEAKRRLENRIGPVLQYWDDADQAWVDVESVTEYFE